jgi:hypothetical protein
LAVRKFLREKTAHRIGCCFGLRQLRKERHDLSFDNSLQDRICFEKGQIEESAGEN